MLDECSDFAMRADVLDMAIGLIIGGAFGKIISSIVNDVIVPAIGVLIGGVDFENFFVTLGPGTYPTLDDAVKAGAPLLEFGIFINTVIDFVIGAFAMLLLVKQVDRFRKLEEPAPAASPAQEVLLRETRHLLACR